MEELLVCGEVLVKANVVVTARDLKPAQVYVTVQGRCVISPVNR